VKAESEAQARLTGAIWFMTTSLHSELLHPLRVQELQAIPLFGECVDCDTLRRLEAALGRLMEAVRDERSDAEAVAAQRD